VATCLLCAVDARRAATPEMRDLVAKIESNTTDGPSNQVGVTFTEAKSRCRWVILAGTYIEPSAWCRWAIFCHDEFDQVVRETISRHLEVALAHGVDASRALGFSIAPYSHAYQRLRDALTVYQKTLRLDAPVRVQ
jgi:hypothetical protein